VDPNGGVALSTSEGTAAGRTKATLVLLSVQAGRVMISQRTLRESKRLHRHVEHTSSARAGSSLAIAAMTFEHDGRRSVAFVPDGTARTAAAKRYCHEDGLVAARRQPYDDT